MAKKVKIDFHKGGHYAGFKKLRNSPEVKADLERRARAIAASAGSGFEVSSQGGKNRARASVITGTFEARREQAKSNVLQRALDSGR